MKKLLLLLLFIPLVSFGQIKKTDSSKYILVGEAKVFGQTQVSLYKDTGNPDYYFFSYINRKYKILTDADSFGFKDIDGAFDYLYDSILEGFKNKSKTVSFELEEGTLIVKYGGGSIQFYFTNKAGIDSFTGYMTKKAFSALFGKKYNKADFKK